MNKPIVYLYQRAPKLVEASSHDGRGGRGKKQIKGTISEVCKLFYAGGYNVILAEVGK